MFTAIKNQEVDRLLFPDYQFLRAYFASPLGRSLAKDYHIVKVFRSPFQIGMVLAIDPEVLNGTEERFVRCLRNEITLEEKRVCACSEPSLKI